MPARRAQTLLAKDKLLRCLTRNEIDGIIGADKRPWNMNRAAAEDWIIAHWTTAVEDEVRECVERIFKVAGGR